MGEKTIRITCEGAAAFAYTDLHVLQGDLKELSQENYQRLKKEILDLGYAEPIAIWQERKGRGAGKSVTNWICNGTQRLRTIKQMVEVEGYTVPLLPVSITHAGSLKEAKHKILALASQYGRVTPQGLYEFIADMDMTVKDLQESFHFPEINYDIFEAEYFKDDLDVTKLGTVETQLSSGNPADLEALPPSGVRMVQLFFNEKTHPEFLEMAQILAARYNTNSVTDTVLEALREASSRQKD